MSRFRSPDDSQGDEAERTGEVRPSEISDAERTVADPDTPRVAPLLPAPLASTPPGSGSATSASPRDRSTTGSFPGFDVGREAIGTDETIDGVGRLARVTGSMPPVSEDSDIYSTRDSQVLVPLVAGRYQVLGLLGTGATGRVYRALDRELDEIVALKVLNQELLDSPEVIARFRQEVKLARRVTHPNVARTFDIGDYGGQRYMTMEFIDGEALRQVIRRSAPMAAAEAIGIVRSLCAGLSAAHSAGIIHRDLKPDNVLVDKRGRVVINDFGIAHAFNAEGNAGQRLAVGTPAYMAPEQVQGLVEPDPRADLYALGCIFFELLTGERAWPGDSAIEVATARLLNPPPDPRDRRAKVPDVLAGLVIMCLGQMPDERPSSALILDRMLADAMEQVADIEPALRTSSSLDGYPAPPPQLESAKTVAVLPFDGGSDAEMDFLVEGVTEDIIDTLSMTDGLRVRPLSAVTQYAGPDVDAGAAGRALGVSAVVTGKVRRRGEQIRIRTRVVSVDDGFQLWAGKFRCSMAEILDVSDEVAVAVAAALTVDARPDEAAVQAPSDGAAIELFLRARHAMRLKWHEDVREAIDLFDQALARAGDDARILAAAAVARARMAFLGTDDADAPALEDAIDLAARAIAASPARTEPYFAMAMVRFNQGRPPAAVDMLEQAIARAPGNSEAHDLLGRILVEIGPLTKAIHHLQTALLFDPASFNTRWDLVRANAFAGDWSGADALLALPVSNDHAAWVRGITRARLDIWRKTPQWLDGGLPSEGGGLMDPLIKLFRAVAARGEATIGEFHRLEEYAEAAASAPRRAMLMHQFIAEIAGFDRDQARCIAAIAQAVDLGLTDVMWLTRCPRLTWLSGDRVFGELVATVAGRVSA